MKDNQKVLGWGAIIAILVGVAVVTGLLLGLTGKLLNLSSKWTTGGVGAAVGILAAGWIAHRRAALQRQKNQ